MEIPHHILKLRYEQQREAIARSVNPDLRPDLNFKNFKEAKAAGIAELKAYYEDLQKFLEESTAEHEAKAAITLPADMDANREISYRATLTREWGGMSMQDILKGWRQVLKTGDKVAVWVYMKEAPFAIAENMSRDPRLVHGFDGNTTRRMPWDRKPYQGKEVLELMDKSLQFCAPDAHKAKERVGQLQREAYDAKIGFSIARTTLEGLKYSDKEGVVDGNADRMRAQIKSAL